MIRNSTTKWTHDMTCVKNFLTIYLVIVLLLDFHVSFHVELPPWKILLGIRRCRGRDICYTKSSLRRLARLHDDKDSYLCTLCNVFRVDYYSSMN